MQKKKKQSDLHKYFYGETETDEILHSHAFRRVEKKVGPSLPRAQRLQASRYRTVADYKQSMVGSIAQYRERITVQPRDAKTKTDTPPSDEGIVGNRPRSGKPDSQGGDNKTDGRRHHFIEPPRRNNNRFS